ncbi:hypothetical protein I79_016773 [Cricetulus griseus]|uniref:Uncharacterized protein n=1 Tax=Cricetulus griseus TaxID=10029 RepID=G3I096_CRIGR|nr:hypothetical protein I79_016773 [Cricetulus griseus]
MSKYFRYVCSRLAKANVAAFNLCILVHHCLLVSFLYQFQNWKSSSSVFNGNPN